MRSYIKSQFSRSRVAGALAFLLALQLILSGFSSIIGGAGTAGAVGANKYITFLYQDFSQEASRLKFNNAGVSGTDLRLTEAVPDKFGSVFNEEKVALNAGSGFSTYFTFSMSDPGNRTGFAPGADGIVFTLQTLSNNAGAVGVGMGYGGISPSIGIEFDTYNNLSDTNDPSDNHIALDIDGSVVHGRGDNPAAVPITGIDFNSGATVHAWIDYDAVAKQIKVYLSQNETRPTTASMTESVDLIGVLGSTDVYAGFTAATGSAWQNHDIGQWFFTNRYDPIDTLNNTYMEAPSIFTVTKEQLESDPSVTDAVYFHSSVDLKNSKGIAGDGIALSIDKTKNITFTDASKQPLADVPSLQTDSNGHVDYYYAMTDPSGVLPGFRVSTEFGAYKDIQITTKPAVDTGDVTPVYNAADPAQQSAVVNVELTRTGGETVTSWGAEYRVKTDNDTGAWTLFGGSSVLDTPGTKPLTVTGLKEDTYYEVRAYAANTNGKSYGSVKSFAVQMPMPKEELKYVSAGPSKIYRDDAESATVVGQNLYWLLKRLPHDDLSVKVTGNGTEYDIPRSDLEATSKNSLKIKLPKPNGAILPVGTYGISIEHNYFDSGIFPNAFELTNDPAYRSINYEEVKVVKEESKNPELDDPNEVDEISLRGPFVVYPDKPNIYHLREPNAVVTLNDNLLFKGQELTVDLDEGTISGNGRFYVNGKNTIPLLATYTIYEGDFEFTTENFVFNLNGGLAGAGSDLTGLNVPVNVNKLIFIPGGIRLSGDVNLGFKMGSVKVEGEATVDALQFQKNRFDLDADFKINTAFKSGPLEAGELRFSVDTRVPEFGAGASAELKKAGIGFDIDLLIVDKKLDSISFAVSKEMKLGNTGAQLTKIGGGVANMSSKTEAPLTFSVLAGMSDYITPKISNTYMVNGNDLKVELSANHFAASGKLAIYKINIAGVDMFVVFNPTGYKGYNKAGFDFNATINIIDVIVGKVVANYFQGSSFTGYAKTAVQIPSSVPLVGGKKLSSAEVGVDSSRFKGALSVIGIGFTVKYPFSTSKFDWDVDMSSTIKNVAKAVVNVGKSIVSGIKSLFWYEDPNLAGEWTAADHDVEGVIGEKLFSASDVRSTAFGTYNAAQLATVIAEANPNVEKSGGKFVHSFVADKSYSALFSIEGEATDLSLVGPNGAASAILFDSSDASKINAYYDETSNKTIVAADLTPGTWKLSSTSSLALTVHQVLFRNEALSLSATAKMLNGSGVQSMIPLSFQKRGKYLVELEESSADAVLLKSDGRPYATEANSASEAYNSQWVAEDGKLYLLVEAPEAGTWYALAGTDAHANLYRMATDVTMSQALQWIEGSEFVSVANFSVLPGSQVMLEIQGASEATRLFRPDGTEYPLVTNSSNSGWNAVYDASQATIRALVEVDQEGYWLIKSNGFTDSLGLTLSPKMTMEQLTSKDATITYSMRIGEKGKYLFDIAGGDAGTKIYGINGQEIALVLDENAANRNAIVDDKGLMVTVDVPSEGMINIQTKLSASIKQYLLTPIPEVAKLKASAGLQRNAYEIEWKVENAKDDTKVSLILANGDRDENGKLIPVGDTIASGLPATGIRTVTLPEGYLPGDYYLAVVADSESYGPVFKTLDEPLRYQAEKMLPKPTGVQAKEIGNGEVKISFTDPGYAETTSYRIYPADSAGNVDYNGTSYEGEVVQANGASQSVTLSGLETGRDYKFRVMAIRAVYGTLAGVNDETLTKLYVSELSDAANVNLPVPNPAKLNVTYLTEDTATNLRSYYPYNVTEEKLAGLSADEKLALLQTLAVTSSGDVTVKVDSDQNVTLKLYVDGVEAQAVNGTPNEFNLGTLAEKDYTIEVEAVNGNGDSSSSFGRLFIDRTAPYLYLKSAVNGQAVEGNRVLLEGVSEVGVTLTINGADVPVDAMGHYSYYASIPEEGVLPIEMLAVDQAGNKTVHKLEVLSANANGDGQPSSDLAALGADDGVFTAAFDPSVDKYELTLDARSKQIRVTAVPIDPTATVTIAGHAADEHYSTEVSVAQGQELPIIVTADGGATKTYTIALKTESDLASLSDLQIVAIHGDASESLLDLSRTFRSTIESYEAAAGADVSAVKLTPKASAEGSLIQVDGATVVSGQASLPIALVDAPIEVKVLSPNEASASSPDWSKAKVYTISISRESIVDSTLSQLQLSGASMTPAAFDSEVLAYSARVGEGTSSVQLNYAATDASSVVTLNGDAVSSSGNSTLELSEGNNRFDLIVKARDGSEHAYTIVIFRDKAFSQNLLLSDLSVEGFELTREFAPLVRNYSAKDSTLGSTVTVTAKASVKDSIVRVNGVKVDENGTAQATLNVGDNSVLVQVESPDKSETNTYSIGITRNFIGGGEKSDAFNVKVNNGANDKIAKGQKTEENGKTVLKVTFLSDETKKMLEEVNANPVITISAGMTPNRMTTELTADLIEKMKQKGAILFIDAGGSYYRLPTAAIDLKQISDTFASGVLSDIVVKVDVRLVGEDERQSISKKAEATGASVIGTPVEFTITYSYNGRTVEANRFSEYVQRALEVPEGTSAAQITTGVRIASDGSLQHIPTVVAHEGDRDFAVMNSFTNSVYALISNKATFSDIAGKWSQAAIENLASRKVLTGQGDGTFAPTRGVTRAEFAAMIVRALGLPSQADGGFTDVKAKDWFAPFVASAKSYGLITGYTDGTFRPQQTITRAEAVAILNKAWVLAGKSAVSESDSALTLERVADQADIPAWARASLGSALKLGLLTGYVDGSVKPLRTVTREETAAMLQNLLIRSDLIDSK